MKFRGGRAVFRLSFLCRRYAPSKLLRDLPESPFKQAIKPMNAIDVKRISTSSLLWVSVAIVSGCAQPSRHSALYDQVANGRDSTLAKIELSNPSNFARSDEAVYVSFYDLGLDDSLHQLAVTLSGKPVASEKIDSDGDGREDGLLALIDFAAGENHTITIASARSRQPRVKRTQAEVSVKQGGEWVPREDRSGFSNYEGGQFVNVEQVTVPEAYTDHSNWIRYEGPGIESDRVGYRVYLDGRNGFDVFGKTVAEPVLQQVGQDGYESYHHPQSWGMDVLKVGDSLGAGGFGHWQDNELVHVKEVGERSASIKQNGILFSGVAIDYAQWQLGDLAIDVNAYFSMHAGSRLVKTQLQLSDELENLAIGLVAHPNTTLIEGPLSIPGDAYSYIATWGPQSVDGEQLGLAIFFRKGDRQRQLNDGSSHIVLVQPSGAELTYYFAAAWEGELGRGIDTREAFETYLNQQAERLTRPIRQRVITQRSVEAKQVPVTADEALSWSKKLADAELERKTLNYHADGWDLHRKRQPKFEYDIIGLLPYAYDELGKETGDARYNEVKHAVTASFIEPDGTIRRYKKSNFNIDSVAPGRALLRVYKESPEPHYKAALDLLRDQLRDQPKTSNGAFWHKKVYPGQLWLDGVYMGMPFLAEYAQLFEDVSQRNASLDEVLHEFAVTRDMLKDEKTGLYYHAWDELREQEWADPRTGLSSQFWARGMGWLAMALVDVLDHIPQEREQDRQKLIDMVADLAKTLERYQDRTGTWWQIMDKPEAVGNYRESSATAMFVYFLAKAANNGYLTEQNFGAGLDAFVKRSHRGMIEQFVLVHADGNVSMANQCYVAGLGFGRDGSYDYYMNEPVVKNDPKGNGPFILAGVEMHKYLKEGS